MASRRISKWTRETVSSREHEIVLGRLADADHVAGDHELGAALRALDDDELAPAEVDRRRRRFAPDPCPRQVLHRKSYLDRTTRPSRCLTQSTRVPCHAVQRRGSSSRRDSRCARRVLSSSASRTRTPQPARAGEAVGRAAAVVPRPDDRGSARRRAQAARRAEARLPKDNKLVLVAPRRAVRRRPDVVELDRRRLARLLLHRGPRHRRPNSTSRR